MSFDNGAIKCSLEIRRCTLVAIDAPKSLQKPQFLRRVSTSDQRGVSGILPQGDGSRQPRPFPIHSSVRFRDRLSAFAINSPQQEAGAWATMGAMDVEKTIEFILDQQAKTETLWQRNEERWQRNEQRWKRAEERMDKFDQSLNRTRKLIQLGAKTLISSQKAAKVELREIRDDIRELTAAQKRTDKKFERLVELLSRRSPNGRH
jgi:hypothetical protein